jgi:hypothetical protein
MAWHIHVNSIGLRFNCEDIRTMRIFQFTNSFIAIDDIRSVLIYPARETSGVIRQHHHAPRWIMKVIYNNDGVYKAFFDNENLARQVYIRLMNTIESNIKEEMKLQSAMGWEATKGF